MTEPIKPALTPEEWTRELAGRAFRTEKRIYPSPFNRYELSDYSPDALAALALYGQSFGFTREDVALLRETISSLWETGGPINREERDRQDARYASLADRIEALLPPEKPSP